MCKGSGRNGDIFLVVCADIKFNLEIPGMKYFMMESS